jgi:hypothetical protein
MAKLIQRLEGIFQPKPTEATEAKVATAVSPYMSIVELYDALEAEHERRAAIKAETAAPGGPAGEAPKPENPVEQDPTPAS